MKPQKPFDLTEDSLLEVAILLARPHFKGVAKQAQIRRAISTSYYAAFHAILRLAADAVIEAKNRNTSLYEDFYRSVDHSQIKAVCNQIKSDSAVWATRVGQHAPSERLSQVAASYLTLHGARERADYRPSSNYVWQEAEAMVATSSALVEALRGLDRDEKRKFLLACTLKDKKR